MTRYTRYAATAEHASIRLACPLCAQDLIRVTRRPIDRLVSLFSPLYRYRCRQHDCRWEGTLRFEGLSLAREPAR